MLSTGSSTAVANELVKMVPLFYWSTSSAAEDMWVVLRRYGAMKDDTQQLEQAYQHVLFVRQLLKMGRLENITKSRMDLNWIFTFYDF